MRARSDDGWPHGLPWFSIERNAAVSSVGNRLSSRTRLRRNPTILSTCSMSTGQASTHAPQVTQSQTASYGIALSTIGAASAAAAGALSSRPYVVPDDRRVRDDVDPLLGIDRHVPDAHDEVLRVQRLAGVPGRAGLLAAAAFGAGEAVEQVLPAEVLERLETERRVLGLEVELRQLAARRELAEEDVREGRRDVEVLAEGQVAEERSDESHVRPPEQPEHGLEDRDRQRSKRDGEGVGDERAFDVAVCSRLEGLGDQLGRDDPRDHAEDHESVAVERQPCRLDDQPPVIGDSDRDEDDHRHDVLHRVDRGPEQPIEGDRQNGLDEPRRSRCWPCRSSGG